LLIGKIFDMKTQESSKNKIFWLAIFVFFGLFVVYGYYEKKEKKQKAAIACQKDRACRYATEDAEAWMKSIKGPQKVVLSKSGIYYYDGLECVGSCKGERAGYYWASDNEVEDPMSCTTKSDAFNNGCLKYIGENSNNEDVDDDRDDGDRCIGGRYTDC
jgi:hypothetical protein